MISARLYTRWRLIVPAFLALMFAASYALAREASFVDPGAGASTSSDEAVKVDPKGDVDTGETVLNVARRTTLFFANQSNAPVQIEKVSVNGDGNAKAEIVNDDCSKQGTLAPQSRCSIEISVTPSTPGSWSVEVLLTHNGAGRIARAKLTGKTTGAAGAGEKKDMGLSLSAKEIAPVNFGEIEIGTGKAVRSALMVNDSFEPITLFSIDVIAAENGLERLEQGCAIDMELKPGESCPVTLVWQPVTRGQISTDLIIRHSGRLGFAVIPIRGVAKGNDTASDKDKDKDKSGNTKTIESKGDAKAGAIPPPPSADDVAKMAVDKIPPLPSSALPAGTTTPPASDGIFHLIGTVGNRAVLLKPDGTTAIAGVGDEISLGDKSAKVTIVTPKSATIIVDGKKKELILGAAPELMTKAAAEQSKGTTAPKLGGATGSSSSTSGAAPLQPTSSGSSYGGGMK